MLSPTVKSALPISYQETCTVAFTFLTILARGFISPFVALRHIVHVGRGFVEGLLGMGEEAPAPAVPKLDLQKLSSKALTALLHDDEAALSQCRLVNAVFFFEPHSNRCQEHAEPCSFMG